MQSKYIATGLVPLIAAAFISCGKTESTRPSQVEPPQVSQTQSEASVPKRYSPEELIVLYRNFVPKANEYYKRIDEAVAGFAERSGLDASQVSKEDYDKIADPIRKEMRQDTDITNLLKLQTNLEISELAEQKLDMNRTRRVKGVLFYKGEQPVKARYDPELTLPISPLELTATYFIKDPLAYQTASGKESVKVGEYYWAQLNEFGEKHGRYVRDSLTRDARDMNNALSVLTEFLKKVKPDASDLFVSSLLDKEPEHVRKGMWNALLLGEGHPDWEYTGLSQIHNFDYNDLQKRQKDLKEAISTLEKILAIK